MVICIYASVDFKLLLFLIWLLFLSRANMPKSEFSKEELIDYSRRIEPHEMMAPQESKSNECDFDGVVVKKHLGWRNTSSTKCSVRNQSLHDGMKNNDDIGIKIFSGEPIMDRKSVFQGHVARIGTREDVSVDLCVWWAKKDVKVSVSILSYWLRSTFSCIF